MAGSNILLDTNIISALISGDPALATKIDGALDVYIPAIVVGELYYGASYSTHIARNLANIGKILSLYKVLPVDDETAQIYGEIKANLRRKGTPVPENDIWIAAIALQHNLVLITRDKHFREIDSAITKSW
jgi:tRNA(fMet)-specific endonuclease VapC